MTSRLENRSIEATGVPCPHGCGEGCLECGERLLVWVSVTEPDEDSDNYGTLACLACEAEHYDGPISLEACRKIWETSL